MEIGMGKVGNEVGFYSVTPVTGDFTSGFWLFKYLKTSWITVPSPKVPKGLARIQTSYDLTLNHYIIHVESHAFIHVRSQCW